MNQKSVFFTALACILFVGLFTSCETDVDLTAPYKSTAVIVGILDYSVDTQFVRINRTYLSEDNAEVYAGVKDSVEYNPAEVSAWLLKKRNGSVIDSLELKYIEKPSRDPGVFYDQNVGFYYTAQPLFTQDEIEDIQYAPYSANPVKMTYKLRVKVHGKTYTAETDFPAISNVTFIPPVLSDNKPRLELYSNTLNKYQNKTFKFKTDKTSARYVGLIRFNFDYTLDNGTEVYDQYVDFRIGKVDNTALKEGNINQMILTSSNWYAFLGNSLRAIPGLAKVRIFDVEYRLVAANSDLNSYWSASNPISEFTPVLNTYTNLDNGAIGILGARSIASARYELSEPSIKIMNEGSFTNGPCYCVQNWAGSNYVCTDGPNNCP